MDYNRPLGVRTESDAVYHLGRIDRDGIRDVTKKNAVLPFTRAELLGYKYGGRIFQGLRIGYPMVLQPEGWSKEWVTERVSVFSYE